MHNRWYVRRSHDHVLLPVDCLNLWGAPIKQVIARIYTATSLLGKVLNVTCLGVRLPHDGGLRGSRRVRKHWLHVNVSMLQVPWVLGLLGGDTLRWRLGINDPRWSIGQHHVLPIGSIRASWSTAATASCIWWLTDQESLWADLRLLIRLVDNSESWVPTGYPFKWILTLPAIF